MYLDALQSGCKKAGKRRWIVAVDGSYCRILDKQPVFSTFPSPLKLVVFSSLARVSSLKVVAASWHSRLKKHGKNNVILKIIIVFMRGSMITSEV